MIRAAAAVFAVLALAGAGLVRANLMSEAESLPAPRGSSVARSIHVPILTYHQIRDLPHEPDRAAFAFSVMPTEFACQLDWLKAHGFHTITPEQLDAAILQGAALPANPIMLTFDDGWANATDAAAMLTSRGMVGVFFICPDLLTPGPGQRYMSWADVQRLSQSGMSIQSHTLSHPRLSTLSSQTLYREIADSKLALEQAIARPVTAIAYPFGDYDPRVLLAAEAAGYQLGFSTEPRASHTRSETLRLGRVNIDYFMTLEQFARSLESVGE